MSGGTPAGSVRRARLLGLTGLCWGFAMAATLGRPATDRLAGVIPPRFYVKTPELAFLVVASLAAGGAALAGRVLAARRGRLTPDREGWLLGALAASVVADFALTAGGPGRIAAVVLCGLGLLGVIAGLSATAGPDGVEQGVPAVRVRSGPGRFGGALVMLGVVWLHHDPLLHYRVIDQLHEGAHLAWASQIAAGHWPGDHLTLMYGPLYSFSLVAWMKLTGWTVVAERWYFVAAQTVGSACAFYVLSRVCVSTAGMLLGLVMIHLLSAAALVAYGWANCLRAGLGLAALVAAVDVLRRDRAPGAGRGLAGALAAGAGLAVALCYSQDAGGAALASFSVLSIAAVCGRGDRIATATRAAAIMAGCMGTVVLVLATLCSGSWPGRLHSFLGFAVLHLHGYMAAWFPVPVMPAPLSVASFLSFISGWTWIAWLAPAACAAVVATAGSAGAPGIRHWQLAAVAVFGLCSLPTSLNRSDHWHILSSSFAGLIVAAAALERSWIFGRDLVRRTDPALGGLRVAYLAALLPAWTAVALLLVSAGWWGLDSNLNVWGSQAMVTRTQFSQDVAGGWRVPFDHPHSGGLVVTRSQGDDLRRTLAEVARRSAPGEPIFAGTGAEAVYFLADRPSAGALPVSLQAGTSAEVEGLVAALARCRVAVVNRVFQVDGKDWEAWEPDIATALHRDFVPAWTGTELQVWRRR